MFRLFISLLMLIGLLRAEETAVLIYGGTPAGIAAALAAARDGERVLLVEPTARLGGLVTTGLSHADFRTFEGLTGAYLEFTQRVEQHYRETYGADSEPLRACRRGTQAEPSVNLAVFERMLAEQPKITVWKNRPLFGVKASGDMDGQSRALGMAAFLNEERQTVTVSADVFIDASYEGDLLAAARAAYRVGREGRAEFGESLAPEQPDGQLQGYNFRLLATQDPANRVAPTKPDGYRREDFTGVLRLFASGKLKSVFGPKAEAIYKVQIPPLPRGKHDINDMSHGPVRLSLPGENLDWPDGGGGAQQRSEGKTADVPFSATGLAQARSRIFLEHLRWNVGLLYFLQNDPAVPKKVAEEARSWGWCRDEFTESGHLPPQLYVREARRLAGERIFTERDTDHAPGDARAVLHRDAIAMGDYGPNCHGTGREGTHFSGRHTGEFYKVVPPYQIPYGTLVPREVENLLVPVAASASHVGFCALRFEPIWMSLGQAAGHAAHLVRAERTVVQRVPVPKLQARLHAAGAATIYVNDVPPSHPDFALVQWWATAGGLHGLAPTPPPDAIRGAPIEGQYYAAFPSHAAELDKALDAALADRWKKLAASLGIANEQIPAADGQITRGAWLRALRR